MGRTWRLVALGAVALALVLGACSSTAPRDDATTASAGPGTVVTTIAAPASVPVPTVATAPSGTVASPPVATVPPSVPVAGSPETSLVDDIGGLGDASQAIVVTSGGWSATTGTLRTFERVNGTWRPKFPETPAYLGLAGTRVDRHEGDRTTPAGIFGFAPLMFGGQPDPGIDTSFSYHQIARGDCWGGDRASYNRLVQRPTCISDVDENLIDDAANQYRYAAVIDFNYAAPVYGKGSGIFLHVGSGPTVGCVAIAEDRLVEILRWLTPTTKIVIGPEDYVRMLDA